LLRFAHKTQKNQLKADFLPCKLRKQPDNRGFFAASSAKNPQVQQAARGLKTADSAGEAAGTVPGIRISIYRNGNGEESLHLIPQCVYIGIGCRKGINQDTVYHTITEVLSQNGIDIRSVAALATINIKKNEPALEAICRQNGWPLLCYTAQELKAAGNGFTSSAFVFSAVGVDNVCERAAFLASQSGSILVRKFTGKGVTAAAAAGKISLNFDTM
jgi:cobalamin biosynthesis protein CbiG